MEGYQKGMQVPSQDKEKKTTAYEACGSAASEGVWARGGEREGRTSERTEEREAKTVENSRTLENA